MKHSLVILMSLFFALTFLCCSDDEEQRFPESDHTLLIYMIGDNVLGKKNNEKTDTAYTTISTIECINGLLKTETPINLLIYEDSYVSDKNGNPILYRLKRNNYDETKIDTLIIHKWDNDHNSVDPTIMRDVIKEAFSLYPSSINGLCIWGNADGWYPSYDFKYNRTKSIGNDRLDDIDIWVLRKVLEQTKHFDYLLLDLPFMCQAEIAYELRKCADYIIGYPTDVMMHGLKYDDVVEALSNNQHQKSIENSLKAIIDSFANYCQSSKKIYGSIALLDLSHIDMLRDKYYDLLQQSYESLNYIRYRLNPIGQKTQYEEYLFYDFLNIVNFFIEQNKPNDIEYDDFVKLISKIVIKEYHTKSFLNVSLENCCGLGISIPEILNNTNKKKAYQELQWYKSYK